MKQLREISARPEAVVGNPRVARLIDPTDQSSLGVAGPFGRERCLYALPLGGVGAQQYVPATFVRDQDSAQLADPDSFVVGVEGLWISRLLFARSVEDTRRL